MRKTTYTRKEIVDFIIENGYMPISSKNKDVDRVFEVFSKSGASDIKIVRTLNMILHSSLKSIIGKKLFDEWCK